MLHHKMRKRRPALTIEAKVERINSQCRCHQEKRDTFVSHPSRSAEDCVRLKPQHEIVHRDSRLSHRWEIIIQTVSQSS